MSVSLFRPMPRLPLMLAALMAAPALAQDAIYRCGNEYTNNPAVAKQRGCTPLQGGNVTVIEGTRPSSSAAPRSSSASSNTAPRVDSAAQRARDADARAILETELRRAEERLAEAQKA